MPKEWKGKNVIVCLLPEEQDIIHEVNMNKTIVMVLVMATSLAMSGCVAPEGEWKIDGTVKHSDEESTIPVPTRPTEQENPKPYIDPCERVDCRPECYGLDLYRTYCIDGICVRGALLEDNSPRCGYVAPTPVPVVTPTPDPCDGVTCISKCFGVDLYGTICSNGICIKHDLIERNSVRCGYVAPTPAVTPTPTPERTPGPEATPEETPGVGETVEHIININPPIYSGVVRNNGEILDIRITDPLIAGEDVRIEVDILNTGTVRSCYEIYWDSDWREIWIYAGDMETFTYTNTMGDPGERTWTFKLEWDAAFPAVNVLLQTATANVRCYTAYEIENL